MASMASIVAQIPVEALLSIPLPDEVQSNNLCDLCRVICNGSVIIQTYIAHGKEEDQDALSKRCHLLEPREAFKFHGVLRHFESFLRGCHLCSMLWLNTMPDGGSAREVIEERSELEAKAGEMSSVLVISCDGLYGTMEIQFRRTLNNEGRRGFCLMGYVRPETSDPYPNPTFPLQLSTRPTAQNVAEMLEFWLEECSQSHDICQSHYENVLSSDVLPTRLIDVSDLEHPWLVTKDLLESDLQPYLTLSHCWPQDSSIVKLTEANIGDFRKSVPWNQLSQVFRDAMAVANAAGYKYIWIDCLCIIQDSVADWTVEANRMAHVYGNAAFNLVAGGLSDNAATMFKPRNPLVKYPCKVASGECSLYVEPASQASLGGISVFSRGWIVQERLLSRRNVYFGFGELVWECFEGHARETCPTNIPPDFESIDKFSVVRNFEDKLHLRRLLDAVKDIPNDKVSSPTEAHLYFARGWARIVELYSATNLTYISDKMAAIAGTASMIRQRAVLRYVAGMWMCTLPAALLWHNSPMYPEDLAERPQWRGAPTWSWASVDGPIRGYWPEHMDPETLSSLQQHAKFSASVLGCRVTEVSSRVTPFGEVEEARLRMKSVLRPITDVDMSDGGWTDGKPEFSSDLVDKVFFAPDAVTPKDTPLHFFTIFRGWGKHWYQGDLEFTEEGIVLTPYRDGFNRVGYMRIYFKESKDSAFTDLLWGGGRMTTIFVF